MSKTRLESASRPASTPSGTPYATRPAARTRLATFLPRLATPLLQAERAQIGARQIARQPVHVDLIFPPLHARGPNDMLEAAEHDVADHRQVEAEARIGRGIPLREQMDELRGEAPQHLARFGIRIAVRAAHLPQPNEE